MNCLKNKVLRVLRNESIKKIKIYLHWLPLEKKSIFKICILIFKIKNDHSPNYLADLSKLPPYKVLRYTYSRFFRTLSIEVMLNLHLPTVAPLYKTHFFPVCLCLEVFSSVFF